MNREIKEKHLIVYLIKGHICSAIIYQILLCNICAVCKTETISKILSELSIT